MSEKTKKTKETEEYLGRAEPADMDRLANMRYYDSNWAYLNDEGSFKRKKHLEK